jgi:two-component system sensor histidine kinase TctE
VIAAHALQAEERDVDLGADAPPRLLLTGREAELRLLLANLVDNALRYAPPGSPVTVSAKRDGAVVEIQIVDGGPGIPAAERESVFQRFYRVEGDPTRGTGLGLAIAKEIADRHRGSIALADANPGATLPGLAVRVRLPAS